jgi:hypothetical protein
MVVPGKLFEDCAARHGLRSAKPPKPLGIAVVFVPAKPRSWLVISPNTEFALGKMRELLGASAERRLSSVKAGPELDRTALFGAMVSMELFEARHIDLVAPAQRRSWSRVSIDGQRTLVFGATVPGGSRP